MIPQFFDLSNRVYIVPFNEVRNTGEDQMWAKNDCVSSKNAGGNLIHELPISSKNRDKLDILRSSCCPREISIL